MSLLAVVIMLILLSFVLLLSTSNAQFDMDEAVDEAV